MGSHYQLEKLVLIECIANGDGAEYSIFVFKAVTDLVFRRAVEVSCRAQHTPQKGLIISVFDFILKETLFNIKL